VSTLVIVLLALPLAAQAPPPGGLPAERSLTVDTTFDYAADDLEALRTRATALRRELSNGGDSLRGDLVVHRERSPYLNIAPFDAAANQAMTAYLRERQSAMQPAIDPDPAPLDAAKRALDDALVRRFACAESCEDHIAAVAQARQTRTALQQLNAARTAAATIERQIIAHQLNYLRRVREDLRVRERRPGEPAIGERLYQRRAIDVELPEAMKREVEAREARKLAAAEQARDKRQLLTNISEACAARDERRGFKQTYDTQLELEGEKTAALAERSDNNQVTHDAYKDKIADLLKAVRGGADVGESFDLLHVELSNRLTAALTTRDQARDQLSQAKLDLASAERDKTAAKGEIPVLAVAPDETDPCSEEGREKEAALQRAQFDAASARADAEESRVAQFQAQAENAAREASLAEKTWEQSRELLRSVLPHLSPGYQAELYKYDGRFFKRLLSNVVSLVSEFFEHTAMRVRQLRDLPGQFFTWAGFATTLNALFWLALLLLIARLALAQWHLWLIAFWDWATGRRYLQRVLEALHTLTKLASVVARPVILLVAAGYVADYLGRHHLEVTTFYVVFEWVMLYRILRSISIACFIGPAWPADRARNLGRALDRQPVLDREPETAALSDRSLHLIIVYFVWRTAVLTSVELMLGQDYLYHLCLDVVGVVQWALLGVLIVWWRSRVAAAYLVSEIPWGARLVKQHHDKLWFALLVLPMAVLIVAKQAVPWLQETFSGAGPFRFITRFLSRRAMEQAAAKTHATVTASKKHSVLPADYVDAFTLRPLNDEQYMVAPRKPVQAIRDLFDFWSEEKREGSVAIIGEAGIGKTTLIRQAVKALDVDDDKVLHGRPDRKLSTERDVIEFLSATFGFEEVPDTLHALEQAILDDPNPLVVIDDAHHCFLKTMGGLVGLDAFVHVVNVTCTNVFWITAFDAYPWFFIKNLKRTEPPFRHIIHLKPWNSADIEGLVMARNADCGYTATFQDLVVDRSAGGQAQYEVVKTARSYFRLLTDVTGGNPSVAIRYWLGALRTEPGRGRLLRVGLYNPAPPSVLATASAEVLFMLTCIAEHASISQDQLAQVLRLPADNVQRMLSYCEENAIIFRQDGVVMLDLDNYREIVRTLSMRGFIYF